MTGGFCPKCGTPRTGERFCAQCGNNFWRSASGGSTTDRAAQPTPGVPSTVPWRAGIGTFGKILLGLIAVAVVIGIIELASGGFIFGSGSTVQDADTPPAGTIWFGSSFDPTTFVISGRTNTVGVQAPFAMVAHLTRSTDGSQMSIRAYLDGGLVATQDANANGTADLWGWSLGALFQPGEWRYEIIDVGGNVLASGSVTAS